MPELPINSLQEHATPFPDQHSPAPTPLLLEGFLRREELAQQFGLSPRTIDRWEALRIGPPRISVGRTILYSIQSVQEWLISNERQQSPVKMRRCSSRVKL
jgi:predicted DNA-binding transcriptional regulator AlpA